MLYDKGYAIKGVQKEFNNDVKIDRAVYCCSFYNIVKIIINTFFCCQECVFNGLAMDICKPHKTLLAPLVPLLYARISGIA
jgi:hypothetical protein